MANADGAGVLVVGAGPVGLSLACELARHGVVPRVIDKSMIAAAESRAIGIHARTLELFGSMGVLDEILEAAQKVRFASMYAGGKRLIHACFDDLDTAYPFVADVPQYDTERILGRHAERLGVRVERGLALAGLEQDAEGVTVTLTDADGRQERARYAYVVGCDGSHSTVRKAAGLVFEGASYPEAWLAADVRVEWELPQDEFHMFYHPQGVVVCFPMLGGRFRIVATVDSVEGDLQRPSTPTLEEVQQVVSTRCHLPAALKDPVWLAAFRIHHRKVDRYQIGRVFVAGDAAHIHSPAGGQGMNTGIQDAVNLAWKLALVAQGRAPEALLESYTAEREPVAREVIHMTDRMTTVATTTNPLLQKIRNGLLPVLGSLNPVQQRLIRALSQLAINYRETPLVEQHGRCDHGPQAGDRAPDVTLPGTTLHRELGVTRHTLLHFSGVNGEAASAPRLEELSALQESFGDLVRLLPVTAKASPAHGAVQDPEGAVHARYGAGPGSLCLVRPDGYVAYRCQQGDVAGLRAYLERVYRPGASSSQS